MADSDKDILITPNVSQTSQPEIKFVGKDNSPVYLKVLDDNTLSFEGTEGQVFSIGPVLSSGTIFSVNDISGVPSITVDADGTITLAPYQDGNIGIGDTTPPYPLTLEASVDTGLISRFYNTSTTNGQGLLIRAGETGTAARVLQVASRDDTKIMTVNSDGKVGIGTTNPGDLLELESTNAVIRLDASASGSGVGWVKFDDQGTSKWALGISKNGLSGSDFHIYEDASSGSPRVTVKDGGNVGIGTTSPSFTNGGGLEIEHAAQANLRVTDSTASASSDFAQSENDLYIVNRKTNGDIKIRVNSSNELMTFDGGNQTVLMGATSMGDNESKVGISGKLRIGDIANTQDGSGRAYLHVDSGSEDPGATSGDFVRLSTLMMDGGADGNNVMYTTYALRNETVSSPNRTWTTLSIVDGVRVDTDSEVLKADGVTGSNLRMWHEIDAMDAKRHWGHINTIGMTYHHTDGGRLGIGTTSPESKLHVSSGTSGDAVLILEADTDNNDEADQPYIVFEQDGGVQHSAIGSHSGATTDNNALILSNSVNSGGIEAGIIFKTGSTTAGYANATERMRILPTGGIKFNDAYTFPTSDGSANQVLQTDGSGNLSFATVSGSGSPAGSDSYVQYNNGGSFGGDADFTWDDTNNRLVIGSTTSQHDGLGKLTVKGTDASFLLEKHDDSASGGPTMTLYRYSASVADNDLIGQVNFRGEGSTGNPSTYLSIRAEIEDTTEGTKDGALIVRGLINNTQTNLAEIHGSGLTLNQGTFNGNMGTTTYKPSVYMDTGTQNVNQTEATLGFNSEVLDPASNASSTTDGHIRLAAGGYYRISYSIPINDDGSTGGDRTRVFTFMQVDDNNSFTSPTTVAQSRAQVYTRENSGGSGLSSSFIYQHTANDYIRLRIDAEGTTDISTESNQSQISIEYLGPA